MSKRRSKRVKPKRDVRNVAAETQTACGSGASQGDQSPGQVPYPIVLSSLAVVVMLLSWCLVGAWKRRGMPPSHRLPVARLLSAHAGGIAPGGLTVQYPFDGAVFPPKIIAPTFRWAESSPTADAWLLVVKLARGKTTISVQCPSPAWTPTETEWQSIQQLSISDPAEVSILGVNSGRPTEIISSGQISISTSTDEVGAPIFYREVNLPFRDAVIDPTHIRWRFGSVSAPETPRVVMQSMPVCGNCHSFSADGSVLGMDVDYANDKGSYAIVRVEEQMTLKASKIITWSDYRREDGETTLGLLSQVSPDGRYVASTVKDGSVFVPRPNLAFSQLFFPIKGMIGIYCRETGAFQTLPGADDPQYVQSNPVWSPDGKWIVFAKSKRYRAEGTGLLSAEECEAFAERGEAFRFDLYRIPFNGGRGGEASPLAGASQNGMSNYFARYSPDGKWIVFCQARNYMLLQPDSQLYIIPSGGGEARRLRCNTDRMNSWHSWSSNGHWMVFSSKAFSPYTQLFLTHFDEAGRSSPPVVLAHFTEPDRAANIPEFVNASAGAIGRIQENFVNDYSYSRQAKSQIDFKDLARAEASCKKALSLNPDNASALYHLGSIRLRQGRIGEVIEYLRAAVQADPEMFEAWFSLGVQLINAKRSEEAAACLEKAVQLRPNYDPPHYYLGLAYQRQEEFEQALIQFEKILELKPDSTPALSQAAYLRATCPQPQLRDYEAAIRMAEEACRLTHFNDPEFLATLARVYAQVGRNDAAVSTSRRAAAVARNGGREDFARRVEHDFSALWRLHPGAEDEQP